MIQAYCHSTLKFCDRMLQTLFSNGPLASLDNEKNERQSPLSQKNLKRLTSWELRNFWDFCTIYELWNNSFVYCLPGTPPLSQQKLWLWWERMKSYREAEMSFITWAQGFKGVRSRIMQDSRYKLGLTQAINYRVHCRNLPVFSQWERRLKS